MTQPKSCARIQCTLVAIEATGIGAVIAEAQLYSCFHRAVRKAARTYCCVTCRFRRVTASVRIWAVRPLGAYQNVVLALVLAR